MANYGKFIGGGLGWVFGGPLGVLFGIAIGSVIDNVVSNTKIEQGQTTKGDFALSLLALVAAVMKADGKILKSELDYVKQYFRQSFGDAEAYEMLSLLKDILKKDIDVRAIAMQIGNNLDNSSKKQLIYFLIEIAKADGHFHTNEKKIIEQIISYLGFSQYEKEALFAMFNGGANNTNNNAYKILEINENANNDEIKKQYKKLAKENHPDKVSYLGEEVKKKANEKFQKIQAAYEYIKKERGFK